MITREYFAGEGKYRLEALAVYSEGGVTVTLFSHAAGHVGACALACPRPSLRDPWRISATVSVLAVLSHEDDIVARSAAKRIASALNVPVSLTCGIHVDHATKTDISRLESAARALCGELIEEGLRLRASWSASASVVAVSGDGSVIGPVDRDLAHTGRGILHQAFSVLLFTTDNRAMLCRRSPNKRLWGGVLADTCAGHVLVGESEADAARRRLAEEIGVSAPLREISSIVYREDHGDGSCECERCAILVGMVPEDYRINEEEIDEVVFVDVAELGSYARGEREPLAPWVRLALLDEGTVLGVREYLRRVDIP